MGGQERRPCGHRGSAEHLPGLVGEAARRRDDAASGGDLFRPGRIDRVGRVRGIGRHAPGRGEPVGDDGDPHTRQRAGEPGNDGRGGQVHRAELQRRGGCGRDVVHQRGQRSDLPVRLRRRRPHRCRVRRQYGLFDEPGGNVDRCGGRLRRGHRRVRQPGERILPAADGEWNRGGRRADRDEDGRR